MHYIFGIEYKAHRERYVPILSGTSQRVIVFANFMAMEGWLGRLSGS